MITLFDLITPSASLQRFHALAIDSERTDTAEHLHRAGREVMEAIAAIVSREPERTH